MRTIIAGSRTLTNPFAVAAAMQAAAKEGIVPTVVLSGGARGVDALGENWARFIGMVPVEVHPADWARHGRAAGPIRNALMVEEADALVAVWDGSSRGTADVIRQAQAAGLRVFVYRTDGKGGGGVQA